MTNQATKAARNLGRAITMAALLGAFAAAFAQAPSPGIYTCVDSKGRRLTADRPIKECIDREQVELSPGGLPRRKIGPSLTADERLAEEDKARKAEEERNRATDEKRRERALVMRFPNRSVHDQEREAALAVVDSVTTASQKRTAELLTQKRFLDTEVEFYKLDPSRTPPKIRRQLDDVDVQLVAQKRFIADQEVEKVRINARFDEELTRLKGLWAQQGVVPSTPGRTGPGPAPAQRAQAPANPSR